MVNRILEHKIEIKSGEDFLSFNSDIDLEYYLLESIANELDELNGKKVYGIEIIKKNNETNIEKKTVVNLSCCKDNTRQILNKLAKNTVTPVGLPFILDDILGI